MTHDKKTPKYEMSFEFQDMIHANHAIVNTRGSARVQLTPGFAPRRKQKLIRETPCAAS
jgi:hypothetical protein